MRFYLVDRVTSIEEGKRISGMKCWTLTDEIFNEHFPGLPIVPGTLIVESMAQLLGILIEKSYPSTFPEEKNRIVALLSIINKAKFREFIIPGDTMVLEAELTNLDRSIAMGKVTATVDGKVKAVSELSFILADASLNQEASSMEPREAYYHFLIDGQRSIRRNDP